MLRRLFRELLSGAAVNAGMLDELMAPYLSRQLEELGQVERAVLRVALFELKMREDVPYKVAINEAIELAKTFGAEDSHKFVNGVLDKVAPTLRKKSKTLRPAFPALISSSGISIWHAANLTSLPAILTGLSACAGMYSWALEMTAHCWQCRKTAGGRQYRYVGRGHSLPAGHRSGRSRV